MVSVQLAFKVFSAYTRFGLPRNCSLSKCDESLICPLGGEWKSFFTAAIFVIWNFYNPSISLDSPFNNCLTIKSIISLAFHWQKICRHCLFVLCIPVKTFLLFSIFQARDSIFGCDSCGHTFDSIFQFCDSIFWVR